MKRLIFLFAFPLIGFWSHAQVQDEKNICAEIERFVDDSSHEITLHSPVLWNNKVVPIIFSKLINDNKISYSLYLTTHSEMVVKNGKGVIVVFSDSTIWKRQGKIGASQVNNHCEYSTVINLTTDDVVLFSTKKIAKYMLYIFDQEIDTTDANNFKIAVKCVNDSE